MILTICPNPSIDKFLEIPLLKIGTTNKSLNERAFPGGKGVHVALAVKELGLKSILAGFWGGPTGQWVQKECENVGVRCFGPEVNGWTRTCLTVKSDFGSEGTEIRERGPQVSKKELAQLLNVIQKHINDVKALCVCGSWPPGCPEHVYNDLKKIADMSGIPMWIDASGARLKEALAVEPHGIHVNRNEAETWMGKGKVPATYAVELLNHCTVAAVTDGANGLYIAIRGKTILHSYCPVKKVISTVGSGDCLLAGLVVSASRNDSLEEMARTGTACGAANCVSPELGIIRYKDVQHYKKQVTCKEIFVDYEK